MKMSVSGLERLGKYVLLNQKEMQTVSGGLLLEASSDTSKKDVDSKEQDSQSGDGKEKSRAPLFF